MPSLTSEDQEGRESTVMENTTIQPQNERHQAILDLLCKGKSRRDIAQGLGLNYTEVCKILSIYQDIAHVQTDTGLVLAIMETRWAQNNGETK